jgi:hypothetical protein
MKTPLGVKAHDTITGFEGIAIARIEYLTGCHQVQLQPKVKADGAYGEPHWFDEQRIAIDDAAPIRLDNGETPGFGAPPPSGQPSVPNR